MRTPECKKYNGAIVSRSSLSLLQYLFLQYNDTYGDKCVNHYILRRDVKRVRNIIALLHKCTDKPDADFYKELMGVEKEIVSSASSLLSCSFLYTQIPGGERCCNKHRKVGPLIYGVAYSVRSRQLYLTCNARFTGSQIKKIPRHAGKGVQATPECSAGPVSHVRSYRYKMFGVHCIIVSLHHSFVDVIKYKLGKAVWEMGKYVYCAAEEACPIDV